MKKTFKSVLALLFVVFMLAGTMTMASALSAPTMKVKSVATASVTLYWTKVSDADGYQIQRTTDGKTWTTLSSSVTATEYTDSKGLTTGKSYGYRVRSYDKKLLTTDYSAWTAMVVGKPLPAKVTGLKVSAANNTAVRLVWNKVAGVSGYTVQYYGGGKWNNYKSVTANTIDVTGLKLGSKYHFRVAAVKVVSGKWIYGAVSDYITTSPVLGATSAVKLNGVNSNAVKLIWAGVSGAKGFEVYNHNTGAWINAGATTSTIISGFEPGEECSFTVRAYAGSIKGKESAVYTFKTAPAMPANVKVVDATHNTLTYSWDAVEGAEGYQVAYFTRANNKWLTLPLTANTSITITGLGSQAECGFRVRAYLTNKNVHNISAYATSAYTPNKVGKTVLPATTVTAVQSNSVTDTSIKWAAVTGAAGYSVEKYDLTHKTWYVYDFSKNAWVSYANISDESVITTTALSFIDSGKSTRGDVYRVRAYDAQGNKGTASKEVTAFTSNVAMNATAGTFVIQQYIEWPAVTNAVSYDVYARHVVNSVETVATFQASKVDQGNGKCKAPIYMSPNSIQSIMIIAKDANGTSNYPATDWVTFKIGEVPILATNHKYYNASVNSQLLYLAQAINNTKAYTDPITVKNNSEVAYSVNSLKIPILLVDKKTPEDVAKFFASFGEDMSDMPTTASEKFDVSYRFENGSAINEDGRTIKLRTYIEPSSSNTAAYLYNSQNYTAWKNGFSSVTAKKNADGSITMTLKFKKENTNTPYHNGYMSAFSAKDFAGDGTGLSVTELSVGASTLTAVIDKDGILKSYVATSPYAAKFAASFTADEGVNEGGVNIIAGSLVSMEMGIGGTTVFKYTFTR